MKPLVIAAVDIGTSSTRALVFEDARFTGRAAAVEYALQRPEPGAAELDPIEVLQALTDCLHQLQSPGAPHIDCVALSSAMHSLMAVDVLGRPLSPAFTWADNRAFREGELLRVESEGLKTYAETGVPIHPMSPLVKLIWLRKTQPALFDRAAKFVSLKEFICHRLFGCWIVDDAIASASGLYDLALRDWSTRALALTGIGRERLSPIGRAETILKGLAPDIAAATGLDPATPFVLGGSDGCLANLGAGLLAGDAGRRAVLTIGTSGALRMAVGKPSVDVSMRTFCYALGQDQFVIGGATNGGGLPLRWLRDNFPQLRLRLPPGESTEADPYAMLARIAEDAPPGADGLLFHPYLAGERAPLWNADARASFIGLNFSHGPSHLVRAVMEGVLFNLAMILTVLEELAGGPVDEIIAGGGFARSPFWLQMAANLFGRTLVIADNPETTAQGAALVALHALGRAASLHQAVAMLPQARQRVCPDSEMHARYAALAPIFAAIPATLAPFYSRLAEFQRDPDHAQ